jgi:hypothetical protein
MTITDSIIIPPPNITNSHGDSGAVLIGSIIFNNNKYVVEGRKFGSQGIYWEIDGLGFIITSNNGPIVFSNNELNISEINQNFKMWHTAGISLKN